MSSKVDEKPKLNIVDEFWKNSGEQEKYVISLNHFQGNEYLDMRLFYLPEGKEEFLPTRKGLSLSVDHLNKLRAGIDKAIERVQGS